MRTEGLIGFVAIFVLPALFLVILWIALQSRELVSLTLSFVLPAYYVALLTPSPSYDSDLVKGVTINQAPREIEEFLKTTTDRGELITVILLLAFRDNQELSQTGLAKFAKDHEGVELTAQRIRHYIKGLEDSKQVQEHQKDARPGVRADRPG